MIAQTAVLTAWLLAGGPPNLDKQTNGNVYSSNRAFRIPLDLTDQERSQIRAIRLFISEDQGRNWLRHMDGAPDMRFVTFQAERDGEYWFLVALEDRDGRQVPPEIRGLEPGLKVVVDSTRPTLTVKPTKSTSANRRGVRWETADENIDPQSIRLAVWENAVSGWREHSIRHPERSLVWFEDRENIVKVQACVSDRAGNQTVQEVEIHGDRFAKRMPESFILDEIAGPGLARRPDVEPRSPATSAARRPIGPPDDEGESPTSAAPKPSSQSMPQLPEPSVSQRTPDLEQEGVVPPRPNPVRRPVGSDQPEPPSVANRPAPPNPRVEGEPIPKASSNPMKHTTASPMGPDAGISHSNDRRVMVYYEVDHQPGATKPRVVVWGTRDEGRTWTKVGSDDDGQSPAEVDLIAEGVWGLKIAIASSAAASSRAPSAGEAPEMFVLVDTAKPVVEMAQPEVHAGQVILQWRAMDANLSRAPIHISYATDPRGPWTTLAERVDNTGEFIWNYARTGESGQFYFRIEASDKAGNSGSFVTPNPVDVGEAPSARGRVLGVKPRTTDNQ